MEETKEKWVCVKTEYPEMFKLNEGYEVVDDNNGLHFKAPNGSHCVCHNFGFYAISQHGENGFTYSRGKTIFICENELAWALIELIEKEDFGWAEDNPEADNIPWKKGDHNQKFLRKFSDGAELWSFVNGGGAPYCAIFYGGNEEVNYPLAGIDGMVKYYCDYRLPKHLMGDK